ncbi:hypothetical protein HanIR_Chr11g0551091 [Helianthus annuus]|nr:hypothetical protein HanIR_Chr11g0551091 [Helianthus annuus]
MDSSWTDEEDIAIAVSYAAAHDEGTHSVSDPAFWGQVLNLFCIHVQQTTRSPNDLDTRCAFLRFKCSRFLGRYKNVKKKDRNNMAEKEVIEEALLDYAIIYDEDFEHISVFEILKNYI